MGITPRLALVAALMVGFGMATHANAQSVGGSEAVHEFDNDRPGSDIRVVDLGQVGQQNPTYCDYLCRLNPSCKAWTLVKPGIQAPWPRCYLKDAIPTRVESDCCVSGVRLFEAPLHAKKGYDQPGLDIESSDLASADANLCRQLCDANANCQAWTYVSPGIQGPSARCYLKSPAPVQVKNDCCISGVKFDIPQVAPKRIE